MIEAETPLLTPTVTWSPHVTVEATVTPSSTGSATVELDGTVIPIETATQVVQTGKYSVYLPLIFK